MVDERQKQKGTGEVTKQPDPREAARQNSRDFQMWPSLGERGGRAPGTRRAQGDLRRNY